ncbi:protein C1orf43 homolog [Euwallacea similis]|uniref:protein C1orf43 homolog n=1 Tax=Euwallacea similis TaxID=1736056 RepID=UPI0034507DFC
MQARAERLTKPKNMSEELNGVAVVIIIGLGVLTIILLILFAKRQIMRFTLRSRRGPHVPIGHDGPKTLKREIERRLDLIPRIVCEPKLITKTDSRYILFPGQQIPAHYYRLKAVDDVKILEAEINKQDPCLMRHPSENLRAYLLSALAAPLNGTGIRLIHQFCDHYEHARHDPSHFGDEEYQQYNRLLLKLVDAAKMLKSYNSRKSSPNRTPVRKQIGIVDKTKTAGSNYSTDEEILSVADSRPTTLSVPLSTDNETSV